MKYKLNGDYLNDSTIKELPQGAVLLSESDWNSRHDLSPEDLLKVARNKKKVELKQWKLSEIGATLQIRSAPDYHVKPSPTENIFCAHGSMTASQTKIWRAMDSQGTKLFELDEFGDRVNPLFLSLTKAELKSASDHYEARKTSVYHQHDLKFFQIDEILTTIEEVEAFDVTQVIA
jgi:hypothetical protein